MGVALGVNVNHIYISTSDLRNCQDGEVGRSKLPTARPGRLAGQALANKPEHRLPAAHQGTSEPCGGRRRRVRIATRCHAPWPTHAAPPSRPEAGERLEAAQPAVRPPCESPRKRAHSLHATPD